MKSFKRSVAILLAVFVVLCSNTVEASNRSVNYFSNMEIGSVLYCKNDTSARAKPSSSAKLVKRYKFGNEITIKQINVDSKWIKICEGGYISIDNLTPIKPILRSKRITKQLVYARDYILADGDVSNYQLNITAILFDRNPENIKRVFLEEGWKFVITDKDLNKVRFNNVIRGSVFGVTSPTDKVIYLYANDTAITVSVCHELGHFVDYMCGLVNGIDDFYTNTDMGFQNVYSVDKGTFRSSVHGMQEHALSSNLEFFAENYSEYIQNKSNEVATAPNTVHYIENYINMIK